MLFTFLISMPSLTATLRYVNLINSLKLWILSFNFDSINLTIVLMKLFQMCCWQSEVICFGDSMDGSPLIGHNSRSINIWFSNWFELYIMAKNLW
jgi:hypothetical protein